MAISTEIKSLTEDIEASYERRIAAVSNLVQETHQSLGNFKREREQMSADLKRSLASNRSDRIRQVQQMRVANNKDLEEITRNITEFLAASEAERSKEFAILIAEVKNLVASIEDETNRTLADFRSNHRVMADTLRSELLSFQKNLSQEVNTFLTDLSTEHRQAQAAWENMTRVMATRRAGKQAPSQKTKKEFAVETQEAF